MKSVIYDNPAFWNLLWVVGGLAIIMALGVTWRRRSLAKFIGSRFTSLLAPGVSLMKLRIKAWLWVLAMAALVLALVDIRWGKQMVEVQQKGVDIMFVLDVSRSMMAEDVTPNRLQRAEEYVGDMLDVMRGDRAGLVVFAGSAKQIVPLTSNYSELKMAMQEAGPHSVSRGGTALGDAIRIAARSFLDKTPDYKAIVIFSDGEDMDSYAAEAATTARKDKGVRIFAVALGDEKQGARVPLQYTSEGKVYLKYDDKEVWSKMNSRLLKQVALAGEGAFIPAGVSRLDMAAVYNQYIDPMQDREFEQSRVSTYIPRYQWFLGVSLLLFLLEALILGRRNGGVMKFFKFVKFSNKTTACIAVGFALFACGAARAEVSPQEAVKAANKALQAGQVDKALKTYEQLQPELPIDAERLTYNKAVAHYRKGELEKARTMLKQAAEQGNKQLEAFARYNIGNCFYSDAITQAKQKKFKEGIELLDKAVGEYRKSLDANQADNDARANIELAELLKKQLKEEQKKQEQQNKDKQKNDKNQQQNKNQDKQDKQKNKDQQQNKNNQQQDQSNKDKQDKNKQDKQDKQQDKNKQQQDKNQQQQNKDKQNDQQNKDKQNQDKAQQDKEQQKKDKEKQQGDKDKQQQEQKQQPQQPQDNKSGEKDKDKQKSGGGADAQPQQAKPKELSDEEAARILQGIRDRNLKRRIENFRKMQAEQAPVDKDW